MTTFKIPLPLKAVPGKPGVSSTAKVWQEITDLASTTFPSVSVSVTLIGFGDLSFPLDP